MRNENKRAKRFTRRALVLAGAKASLMFALASRLYYLQVLRSDEYKTLSDSNRIKLFLIPPLRGAIHDRFGKPVSDNQVDYRVLLDKHEVNNRKAVLQKFAELLNYSDSSVASLFKRVANHRGPRPVMLREHLSWKEVAVIEANAAHLPGINIEAGQVRYYPYHDTLAHLIGYVGTVSEKEMDAQPLLKHPDFKIGKNGIEKAYEYKLRGKAGVKRMEVNAYGLSVRELSREDSTLGDELFLTVDMRLQEFIQQKLQQHKSGSAVVMDVETGDVLSMCSSPSYDPNKFVNGISQKYWDELLNNPHRPLINRPIAQQYPPGSTFKPIVSLALLSEGIDPHEKVYCPGYVDLGKFRFRCWKKGGHGHLDMHGAIMNSCNVYFFVMSQRIGVGPIEKFARAFGLGEETGIEIPGEKSGLVPSRKWKMGRFAQHWQTGDTLNTSIGQGFMLTTPLQLATMVSRLAGRGNIIKPHIIMDKENNQLPEWDKIKNIPEGHYDIVLGGMEAVMNTPGGTAFRLRIREPRFAMAGKTGTAQVISKKKLENNEAAAKAWYNQNHALFIGYAPIHKPKYATAIVIDHGMSGSRTAAPLGHDILLKVQQLESGKMQPKTLEVEDA